MIIRHNTLPIHALPINNDYEPQLWNAQMCSFLFRLSRKMS
jgi:hypothetical protein